MPGNGPTIGEGLGLFPWPSYIPWPYASLNIPGAVFWVILWLVIYVVVDVFVSNLLIERRNKGHWFFMHAFANFFVVVLAFPDVIYTLQDPMYSLDLRNCDARLWACNDVAACNIMAIHLYHVLAYSNLTADDWFHHLLFCTTILPLHFVYSWGTWSNTLPFFVSGLPGGIDYFLLFLVKYGAMNPTREKELNVYLNMWCRSPGLVTVCVLCYVGYKYSVHTIPVIPTIIGCMLVLFNGQYYAERVVASANGAKPSAKPGEKKSTLRRLSDSLAPQQGKDL